MRISISLLVFLFPLFLAAQTPPPSDIPTDTTSETAPSEQDSEATIVSGNQADLLIGIIEDYDYNPEDKRDPFKPFIENETALGVQITRPISEPVLPLERFDINELKLVGIIWGSDTPKAMFVDPANRSYIATVNDRIGQNRGYIAAIREGEVIVVEPFGRRGTIAYRTRVLTLERPGE